MAGIGLAVVGYAGRFILRKAPNITEQMTKAAEMLPKLDAQVRFIDFDRMCDLYFILNEFQSLANSKYYKGGFDAKMSKREASLILGVSPTANKQRIKVPTLLVLSIFI